MEKSIENKAVLWGFEGIPLITWVPTNQGLVYERIKMHDRFWVVSKCLPSGTVIYREFEPDGQTDQKS